LLTAACFGAAAASGSGIAVSFFLQPARYRRQQCRLAALGDGFFAPCFAEAAVFGCAAAS